MLHVSLPCLVATDKKRDTREYWDARLTRMGLSMEAGRHDWLAFGHRVSDLDFDGRKTYPTGETEEVIEWPISL